MQKQTTHLTLLLFRRIAHPYLKRAMTIRPGIKCRMWSRSVPPEAGRISLRSVQADPGQRVVTGTSQAIIIYTNGSDSNPIMMIRATSRAKKNFFFLNPIQIWIGFGKSDPANRIRPDSGYPLAAMAITDRTRNGSGMFTASIYILLLVCE